MVLCHTILKFLLASGGSSYTSDVRVLTLMCICLHMHGFFLEKIKWEQIKISKIERSQDFNWLLSALSTSSLLSVGFQRKQSALFAHLDKSLHLHAYAHMYIYMHTCTLTLVEEQLNDDILLPEGRLGKTNLDSIFMPH